MITGFHTIVYADDAEQGDQWAAVPTHQLHGRAERQPALGVEPEAAG